MNVNGTDVLASTPLQHFQVQILSTKMEAALLELLLQHAKEAGTKASLIFTTVGGKVEAKFEVELVSAGPATASPKPTATTTAPGGDRHQRRSRRHRGPAALAHSKARAAAHQASLAMPFPPPPLPPPTSRL